MSAPTRILYVSHMSSLSGAERALLGLLSHLDRDRFEPIVALPSDGRFVTALQSLGVRCVVTPLAWWIPATHWSPEEYATQSAGLDSRVEQLEALAREEGVALIHSNTLVSLEGAIVAARLGLPHLWHSRGPFYEESPPRYFARPALLYGVVDLLSDVLLCVSRATAAQAAPSCRVTRLEVVHDALDLPEFLSQPVSSREEWCRQNGLEPGARLIACVGGVQRRKGQLDLVDVAARLAPAFPEVRALLCGAVSEPAYREAIERRAAQLGVGDRMVFLGNVGNVLAVLRHCELLVHPAVAEGFGLAVLEGMAAGLPVVATRSGGPEEIVEDGSSGFLVGVGAADEMAAAVGSLLSDRDLSAAMGRAAALRARAFSLESAARRVESVYAALLASRDAPWRSPARARAAELVLEAYLAAVAALARGQEVTAEPLAAGVEPVPPGPLFGHIDSRDVEVRGLAEVSLCGWAASSRHGAPVREVTLRLGGQVLARINRFSARPDVAGHFGRKDLLQSGWQATVAVPRLPEGVYELSAEATDPDGVTGALGRTRVRVLR